jgi:hypothetical protein
MREAISYPEPETIEQCAKRTGISVKNLLEAQRELEGTRQRTGERLIHNLINKGVIKRGLLIR